MTSDQIKIITGPDGLFLCPEDGCLAKAQTRQGIKMHWTRSHKQKQGVDPNELFELTGKALDVLFPNGIPASRVIEIADLQKVMLKVLSR